MAGAVLLRRAPATACRRVLAWRRSVALPYSRRGAFLGANHVLAQYFFTGFAGGHNHRELAAIHHRNAVGERQHFIELGTDEEDGFTLSAGVEQLLVNELDRTDIHSARWLGREQDGKVATHFPGHYDF